MDNDVGDVSQFSLDLPVGMEFANRLCAVDVSSREQTSPKRPARVRFPPSATQDVESSMEGVKMKKVVSIARALKEKNRVAGRLAKARQLVNKENSKEKKVPRGVDVKAVYAEAKTLRDRLVAIKTAIAVANQPIVGRIVELAEVKSEIAYLNALDVQEGVFEESSYGGKLVKEYDAVLQKTEVLAEVDALQRRADELQDALDEFNASVKVEIEVD